MASSDAMTVALNPDFQQRVKYFMQKAAISVMSEENTVPGHTSRVLYAEKILSGEADQDEFAVGVLTNSTLEGEGFAASDSDLEFAVNSLFNAFSGVAN